MEINLAYLQNIFCFSNKVLDPVSSPIPTMMVNGHSTSPVSQHNSAWSRRMGRRRRSSCWGNNLGNPRIRDLIAPAQPFRKSAPVLFRAGTVTSALWWSQVFVVKNGEKMSYLVTKVQRRQREEEHWKGCKRMGLSKERLIKGLEQQINWWDLSNSRGVASLSSFIPSVFDLRRQILWFTNLRSLIPFDRKTLNHSDNLRIY